MELGISSVPSDGVRDKCGNPADGRIVGYHAGAYLAVDDATIFRSLHRGVCQIILRLLEFSGNVRGELAWPQIGNFLQRTSAQAEETASTAAPASSCRLLV